MHSLDSLGPDVVEIVWPLVIVLTYVGALLTGVVKSLTTDRQPNRRNIRIVTAVLTIPIWLIVASLSFLWFDLFKQPPTLAELQHDFPSKRADLEMLLGMSDEDANFSRIAPDFVDGAPYDPNEIRRSLGNPPKAGLPKARWDLYRAIFLRNGINLGV
jgi:hypothetical protein